MAIRKALRAEYYLADLPQDVIDADEAVAVQPPPLIGVEAQTTGVVLADSGKIAVPVLWPGRDRHLSFAPRRARRLRRLERHHRPHHPRDGPRAEHGRGASRLVGQDAALGGRELIG